MFKISVEQLSDNNWIAWATYEHLQCEYAFVDSSIDALLAGDLREFLRDPMAYHEAAEAKDR
jgi:hypothetical protein